ncbi:MAG: DUF371 domain-containing protein [Candidatus Aenigmatarchaeota archaeon]
MEKFEIIRRVYEEGKPFFYSQNAIFSLEQRGWRIVKIFGNIKEEIIAYGHKNVKASHETTIEITKDDYLTERGDCIIGIKANKACSDFSEEFKIALKSGAKVKITLECENEKDEFFGFGSPALKLSDNRSVVIRRSDYIDERTAIILADKAAKDLKRSLIEKLKEEKMLKVILEIIG